MFIEIARPAVAPERGAEFVSAVSRILALAAAEGCGRRGGPGGTREIKGDPDARVDIGSFLHRFRFSSKSCDLPSGPCTLRKEDRQGHGLGLIENDGPKDEEPFNGVRDIITHDQESILEPPTPGVAHADPACPDGAFRTSSQTSSERST